MNLDDSQRKKIAEWIKQGLKLAEIQNRIVAELGVKMTYMEVRLLVDDLKLIPKDVDPPKPASSVLAASSTAGPAPRAPSPEPKESPTPASAPGATAPGGVS